MLMNIFLNLFRLKREEHNSHIVSTFHKRYLTSSHIFSELMKAVNKSLLFLTLTHETYADT